MSMFAFAWATFEFSKNSFLFFLACGYLWIGSVDFLHTLVYEGMNLSAHNDVITSPQLWVGARFAEATLLLVAPLIAGRKLNRYVLATILGVITTGLTILTLSGNLPTINVDAMDFGNFEIISTLVIILILVLALVTLFRLGRSISLEEKTLVAVSIVFVMLSEVTFAAPFSVSAASVTSAHIFTLFSYWLIFQTIVLLNLKRPYLELLNEKEISAEQMSKIQDQERRLEAIFDGITDGIIVTDRRQNIVSVNHGIEVMFGIPADDLIGENLSILHASGEEDLMQEGLPGGTSNDPENRLFHRDYGRADGSTFVGETLVSDIKSISGETSGSVWVIRDVTEQMQIDAQLRRSQKMEAVGQLSGGIAHDFNNILGIVIGNLEILQHMIPDGDKASARVETALRGANRGADLTARLLGISRAGSSGTRVIFVNEIVERMEDLLAKSLTVEVNVVRRLAVELWPVEVDGGDLQDAILNLVLNARDAMDGPGELVFDTRNVVFHEDYVRRNPQGKAGEFVVLSVSDTGPGMTQAVRERAAAPFFSTKAEGKGSGLGLSMVYGFVRRSGGHMRIESSPGNGTTVSICLPRAHATAEAEARSTPQSEISGGAETILVVDDEEDLTEIAVMHLNRLGYQTTTASDARQALAILSGDTEIDLLFSDVVMPGSMNGYDLANEALKVQPGLKVLLTSGITGKPEGRKYDGAPLDRMRFGDFLDKPYSPKGLAACVRRALDEPN